PGRARPTHRRPRCAARLDRRRRVPLRDAARERPRGDRRRAGARRHRARHHRRRRGRRGILRRRPYRVAGHALPAGPRAPRSRAAGGGAASLSMPATGTVADAVAALAAGSLVVFPTETVYGLGADARSPAAVARLVAVRGREAEKPILVLVADLEMAASVSVE